jgi:hypothetical protein
VGNWTQQGPLEIGVRVSTPHQVTRTRTLEHGVEEWSCIECSRRLLMRTPPAFEQFVLDRGDECAAHVGGTGGLRPAGFQARPAPAVGLSDRERGWLAEHGITWEPDGNP